jgi:hypothetical protein
MSGDKPRVGMPFRCCAGRGHRRDCTMSEWGRRDGLTPRHGTIFAGQIAAERHSSSGNRADCLFYDALWQGKDSIELRCLTGSHIKCEGGSTGAWYWRPHIQPGTRVEVRCRLHLVGGIGL